MPVPDPTITSVPRLPVIVMLPAALLLMTSLGLAWVVHMARQENAALRGELTTIMLAQRTTAARGSLAADAMRRVARLEQTLALVRRDSPVVPAPDQSQTVEFERLIGFLRQEITAAHQTIERLKQDGASEKPDKTP